jgi:nucleoside-diphosphate-sugar epimerase
MNNEKKTILITGINGFVGKSLARFLSIQGLTIKGLGRGSSSGNFEYKQIEDIAKIEAAEDFFAGVDVVVHLVGKAHHFGKAAQATDEYYKINVDGTTAVAKACVKSGVKRIIFLSSVKAAGERTKADGYLDESSACNPEDDYGKSKLAAEEELISLCKTSSMEYVILRPPLVYGPNVKGNFASLIKMIQKVPVLPLGGIQNSRSMVGIDNLCSAIYYALFNEKVVGNTYFVSDAQPISTSDLLKNISQVFNSKLILIPIPDFLWRLGKLLPYVSGKVSKLTDSLVIKPDKFIHDSGWQPKLNMLEQLEKMREDD